MRQNFLLLLVLFSILCVGCCQSEDTKMDKFIDDLMGKMTLEEKLGQLNLPAYSESGIVTGLEKNENLHEKIRNGQVGAVLNVKTLEDVIAIQKIAVTESRLKIPLLFGLDVIHGYKTIFPIPLGLSATWDMEAIEQTARIAAIEASADGVNWTFSPMVDISRDPRWGRVAEGAGEDPFLGGEIAKAMVRGYQGDNTFSDNTHILACVKHYALYGGSEAGRDYNTVDMSRIRMFNEYMYPYQAAIEAGAVSVMASFNEVDGIPATANKWLMTEVLRDQWGFDGFVVSDYNGVSEMIVHGMGDLQTVSAMALKAGVDMDMVSEGYLTTLLKSVKEGKVTEAEINLACRRILESKYKLGLFEDPFKFCNPERPKNELYTPENRAFARKISAESFVLLKNDNQTLPLKKGKTIAVVGPLANTSSNMPGTWSISVEPNVSKTVVEGIRETAGKDAKVLYAKGSNLYADKVREGRATLRGSSLGRDNRTEAELLREALDIAKKSDVVVAVMGEAVMMNGEGNSRAEIDIPDTQRDLLKALLQTGKPVVLVLFTGRPLTLKWENDHIPAILNVWFGGTEAALAIGDVLFGDVNPSGKLTMSFPEYVGQIPSFYNHKNTGRPGRGELSSFSSSYLDMPNEPLYPFGFGLSYTNFQYGDIQLSANELSGNAALKASVTVENTGKYDGKEVVQLYIRDMVGSVTRPVKELKGFKKIFLKAGESQTVEFEITTDLLKFYNYDLNYDWEAGEFEIMLGSNSRDLKKASVVWSK